MNTTQSITSSVPAATEPVSPLSASPDTNSMKTTSTTQPENIQLIIKNHKHRQKVSLSELELKQIPFLHTTWKNAVLATPADHELQPSTVFLPASTASVGNLLLFVKGLPLNLRKKSESTRELSALAVALEMEDLATLLLQMSVANNSAGTNRKMNKKKKKKTQETGSACSAK